MHICLQVVGSLCLSKKAISVVSGNFHVLDKVKENKSLFPLFVSDSQAYFAFPCVLAVHAVGCVFKDA